MQRKGGASMNRITIMDEDQNTENAVMQQVSGMGIKEAEDVSTDDLLYLINQTNSANQDYLNESERLRQQKFEEEKRLEAQKEEERIRRENEQRFMEEEKARLERIRQEEEETLKKPKKQESIQQQEKKEKAAKKRGEHLTFKMTFFIILAYNICSIGTALYLLFGGGMR